MPGESDQEYQEFLTWVQLGDDRAAPPDWTCVQSNKWHWRAELYDEQQEPDPKAALADVLRRLALHQARRLLRKCRTQGGDLVLTPGELTRLIVGMTSAGLLEGSEGSVQDLSGLSDDELEYVARAEKLIRGAL
eukprot:GHVR01158813.1.p1 GENE.GHVR01158813.1~~GHVR01158813.1.p1  ORF type:complete len:134 (-),score=22.60 GHVR01158813.1:374-775(-)